MKRLLSLVVGLLCLSTAACAGAPAGALADLRAETAGGWHQTYEAHGRTITVDVPVQVPDVDAIPALTAETLPLRADLPDTSAMSEGYDAEDHMYCNEPGFFRMDTPSQAALRSFLRSRGDEEYPRGFDTPPHIVRFNDLDWDTAYSYNLSATLRDADALMQRTLNEYFSDEDVVLMPHWIHARGGYRRYDQQAGTFSGEAWQGTRVPLIVYFDQVLRGVPVITSAAEAFHQYADTTINKDASIHFGGVAILQDEGMPEWYTSAQFTNMLRVKDVLAENIPLCDFATVLRSCEQLIADGRLRKVDSLRLGYVAWYGEQGDYTLMPCWVLEGELFESASAEYRSRVTEALSAAAEYGSLLFDAQTGEFIDPWATPKDRAYHAPEIVR